MTPTLLAVDLGLRTGFALYDQDGRLSWYRSQNFGTKARLRRAARNILADQPDLMWLIIEGGGTLADAWLKEAARREILTQQISAEQWRADMLYPREQRNASTAKQSAHELARRVIDWSAAPRPTSLRHDAAEAILIGLWGAIQVGWLSEIPASIRLKS